MARQRAPNFESDGLIDEIRKDAVPTYHTASDPVVSNEPTLEKAKETLTVKATPQKIPKETIVAPKEDVIPDDSTDKYSQMNLAESEIEYIKSFIATRNFTKVNQTGKPIMIRNQHYKVIRNILQVLDEEAKIAAYIDNVLTEHFKKYYSTIVDISRKCPPKF